jgi:hypothetical protein
LKTEAQKQRNREHQRTYYQRHKVRLAKEAKEYAAKNKEKISKWHADYYQRTKIVRDAKSILYKHKNRRSVNEWHRKRSYVGKEIPDKTYAFYRDFIKDVDLVIDKTDRTIIYATLLALPLTEKQKQLVTLSFNGESQIDIARKLGLNQSTVCKMWNGSANYITYKMYGGIYNKFLKFLEKEDTIRQYLDSLKLRWQKDGQDGNARKEEPK